MHCHQRVDAFDFNDDDSFDDEIDSICGRKVHAGVFNRHWNLALKVQSTVFELVAKRLLVCAFDKPWTETRMNFQGSADDFVTDGVRAHVLRVLSVPSVLCALCSPLCPWLRQGVP